MSYWPISLKTFAIVASWIMNWSCVLLYYTLPGFTWDTMLKHICTNFELLTDIEMIMFIERNIRGSLNQCFNRYARANNRYMQLYNPSKRLSYLMYFDVNNLYSWARCQLLYYADFWWVDDIINFNVTDIALEFPIGCSRGQLGVFTTSTQCSLRSTVLSDAR